MASEEDLEFLLSLQKEFHDDARDALTECENLLLEFENNKTEDQMDDFKRRLHSLKGSARAVEYEKMASALHKLEETCANSAAAEFVDNSLKTLDGLKDYVEKLDDEDKESAEGVIAGLI
jgi:chemotaxis protein histidine kinase CheA